MRWYAAFCATCLLFLFSCKNDPSKRSDEVVSTAEATRKPIASEKEEAEPDLSEFTKKKEDVAQEQQKPVITPQKEEKAAPKPKPAPPKKKKKPLRYGEIKVDNLVFDAGDMTEGEVVKHKFIFENVGKAPLEIKEADASCGCTTPSIPFLAIEPGDKGYIGVDYSSVGKDGPQEATVKIKTNGKPQYVTLTIRANVSPAVKNTDLDTVKMLKDTIKN